MTKKEIEASAKKLARFWYEEEYGGQHWWTADEIVEDFLIWLMENKEKVMGEMFK